MPKLDIENNKKIKSNLDDKIFIHFDTKEQCTNFIKTSKSSTFGHICCYGKGVHIKTYNNIKINNYDQIKDIKKIWNYYYNGFIAK